MKHPFIIVSSLMLSTLLLSPITYGADAAGDSTSAGGEKINLDSLKKTFGSANTKVSVVQSRLYPKKHRLELGGYFGSVSTDVFVETINYGGHLGYYFNEYFGINGLYWITKNTKSDAMVKFESQNGFGVNTVEPEKLMGLELVINPIYGKLSFMNLFVLHYDFHLLAGVAQNTTESGKYITPLYGLGQQIFLTKMFFLRMDYRKMYFKENIKEKVLTSSLGSVIGSRTNSSGVFTFGLGLFLF